jgi:ribonuclease HI
MNQKRRGMEVDTICPLCLRLNEDGGHLFFKCKMVKQIWRQLLMEKTRIKLSECPNEMLLLESILSLEEEEKILTCCTLWIWWAERNKANSGNKVRKPQQIVSSIISHTTEYKALGKKEQNPKNQVPPKWSLPMHNYVKINTDGAYRESSRTGGWGFIMRNDQGFPVAAGCGHIQVAGSAMQAEAIAILQAVKITSQMGCNRAQLEMDAINLKKAITSKDYDLSPLGPLFKEVKALICNVYDDVKVSTCNRTCNKIAHELAARGALLGDGNQEIWIADLPQSVIELCADNMSSTLV